MSFTVMLVALIYMVLFCTGGPVLADGKQFVATGWKNLAARP